MAAELKEAWPDVEVRFLESSGGVFEVTLDDEELVFSKKSLGRHADPGEVVGLIRQRQ